MQGRIIFKDINLKAPQLYAHELNRLFHEYLLFGGYPDVVLEPNIEEKKAILEELANSYVKKDAIEAQIKYPNIPLRLIHFENVIEFEFEDKRSV